MVGPLTLPSPPRRGRGICFLPLASGERIELISQSAKNYIGLAAEYKAAQGA
jgi:hypothetical protein